MTMVADYSLDIVYPRDASSAMHQHRPPFQAYDSAAVTFFDSFITLVEERRDVLAFQIGDGVRDVADGRVYRDVLQPHSSCYYRPYSVFVDKLHIGDRIEVAQ